MSPNNPLCTMFNNVRPSFDSSIACSNANVAHLPVFSDVSTNSHASSNVRIMGTSETACLPFFIAARQIGVCHSHEVEQITASSFSSAHKRLKSVGPRSYNFGVGLPDSSIHLLALYSRSGLISQIAGTSTPSMPS